MTSSNKDTRQPILQNGAFGLAAIIAISLCALPRIFTPIPVKAEPQTAQNHVITVNGEGETSAKPDLGIMMMTIRSASPIAGEAVAENGRKAKAVEAALGALKLSPQSYKITPVTFGHGAGASYEPNQPEIVAYEASQSVDVFFGAADLSGTHLTEKAAAIIEALRKAGAVPAGGGDLIIYTLKDSDMYERQALQQALGRAHDAAEGLAKGMGAQIAGVRKVAASYSGGDLGYRDEALEGLSYRYYSPKSDEIRIHANATVEYDFN